jgi:hypothetical protein
MAVILIREKLIVGMDFLSKQKMEVNGFYTN